MFEKFKSLSWKYKFAILITFVWVFVSVNEIIGSRHKTQIYYAFLLPSVIWGVYFVFTSYFRDNGNKIYFIANVGVFVFLATMFISQNIYYRDNQIYWYSGSDYSTRTIEQSAINFLAKNKDCIEKCANKRQKEFDSAKPIK